MAAEIKTFPLRLNEGPLTTVLHVLEVQILTWQRPPGAVVGLGKAHCRPRRRSDAPKTIPEDPVALGRLHKTRPRTSHRLVAARRAETPVASRRSGRKHLRLSARTWSDRAAEFERRGGDNTCVVDARCFGPYSMPRGDVPDGRRGLDRDGSTVDDHGYRDRRPTHTVSVHFPRQDGVSTGSPRDRGLSS